MNSKLLARARKIVRHREFLEDHTKADLQLCSQELQDAQTELEQSMAILNAVSAWKSTQNMGGGLDLTLYQSALQFESSSAAAVSVAELAQEQASVKKLAATAKYLAAINSTNVVTSRLDRIAEQWQMHNEHALADQVADLWLANKDRTK